jgi:hypothetical protein
MQLREANVNVRRRAPNERKSWAGSWRCFSPRREPRSRSGAGSEHFRAALSHLLLLATLVGQVSACAGAEPTGREEAPGESSSAASAVVPAIDPRARCIDAGVVPEREATDPMRSSCTVQLTRRGDPLTIEYQIK